MYIYIYVYTCSTVFQLDVARVGQRLELARGRVAYQNAESVLTKAAYGGIGPKHRTKARATNLVLVVE